MLRRLLIVGLALAQVSFVSTLAAQAQPVGPLGASLQRHGLVQSWAARIRLDPTRDRITSVVLEQGLILVSTDAAVLQALDSETGRTLWTIRVGNSSYLGMPAAANAEFVAVSNGSKLYIIDRKDGRVLWDQRLSGSPSASAALGDKRIYVPMTGGTLEAFLLGRERSEDAPSISRGAGSLEVAPLVTPEAVVWASAEGVVYSGKLDTLTLQFRLETQAEILAPLAYSPPNVIAASRDGYVYAIHAKKGETSWRFSSAQSIVHQPVPIGPNVYIIPETGGTYCVSAAEGLEQWFAPGIAQFLAASESKLYVADQNGRLLILDRQSGRRLGSIPAELLPLKIVNVRTDRIYVGSPTGLLVCLHEPGHSKPLMHIQPPVPAQSTPDGAAPPLDPAADKPADSTTPAPAAPPADAPPAAAPDESDAEQDAGADPQ